ncbi:Uncharacterised protein [Bordetella pertussis]|nr:Uncharacterised protein [Bordetella pertussis]
MQDGQQADGIDRPVQGLPALAQLAHGPLGRGGRQRRHQHERGKTHGDEWPLAHILQHGHRIQAAIPPYPGQEMQAAVEKRKQPAHATQPHQRGLAGQPPQRRDRQGDQQAHQRPGAGGPGQEFDGVGAQAVVGPQPEPARERQQAGHEQQRLDAPDRAGCQGGGRHGPRGGARLDRVIGHGDLSNWPAGPGPGRGWRPARRSR